MVDAGPYILSIALLAILVLSLGSSAVVLRKLLLPSWEGAPAHLVEAIVGVALLIWLSELLGVVNLLHAGVLVASAVALAAAVWFLAGRGEGPGSPARKLDFSPAESAPLAESGGEKWDAASGRGTPSPPRIASLVALGVVALVFAHWGLTAADALGRGIFNFDSLWYHMPFAVEIAKSHSVTGIHYTETVFTNWFYPQNSELLHAVGILLTERDTLSLFLNFGWLAVAFLAAWCIGRPYGKGPLAVVATGIVLECHTLVVREPGAAKNDMMAAALLLAAIAILVTAWARASRPRVLSPGEGGSARKLDFSPAESAPLAESEGEKWDAASDQTPPPPPPAPPAGEASSGGKSLPVGWGLATAGLATGLAVGTKSTALAMAAALSLAVVVLLPRGKKLVGATWWFLAGLAGGGYWYLRNLVVVGNPLPQLESLGPISLPHPERLQSGRPDFSISHYATDTTVWREYFGPGLDNAFGALWPLVVAGAIAGGLVALVWGRERVLRWMGFVALFGLVAYVFTPLSAAGAEGMPDGFGINIRYAIPALLAGLALLPVALSSVRRLASSAGAQGDSPAGGVGEGGVRSDAASHFSPPDSASGAGSAGEKSSFRPDPPFHGVGSRGRYAWSLATWAFMAALLLVLVATNRADAVVRDPDRLFAWGLALLFVLIPAGLVYLRRHGASRGVVAAGFATLAIVVAAIGYPVQRDYLEDRFANENSATAIPGMDLDSAYAWARDVEGSRIGLAGTTAGFLQYGLYGTDLSNDVRYLGRKSPHGAFNAIPTCREFRAAVNAADLDYLITAPFLNFIEPEKPIPSPEAAWLRGEQALTPLDREGPVTVWSIDGQLDPSSCGPANAPLRRIPQQPE